MITLKLSAFSKSEVRWLCGGFSRMISQFRADTNCSGNCENCSKVNLCNSLTSTYTYLIKEIDNNFPHVKVKKD